VGVVLGTFRTASGIVDIATANSVSSNVSVLLGKGDGTFQDAVNYGVGASPQGIALADLDGDGNLDLVTPNFGGTVSVLLGNGDGTFRAARNFPAGSSPSSVAVCDVNRDSIPDLVVANFNTGTVSVLLGVGDGTFQSPVTYPVGTQPDFVACAALTGSGFPDLVVSNYFGGGISVLLNNGDGTFAPRVFYATAGILPTGIAIADFDGDLVPDIAVGNQDSTVNNLSILRGNGDGTLEAARNYRVGPNTYLSGIAAGDYNGDRSIDLAVADQNNSVVHVLLGNGDGTFQSTMNFNTSGNTWDVATASLTGTGLLDLVTANKGTNDVSVLLNDGAWGAARPGAALMHQLAAPAADAPAPDARAVQTRTVSASAADGSSAGTDVTLQRATTSHERGWEEVALRALLRTSTRGYGLEDVDWAVGGLSGATV
jgi:hypothetical protein